MNPTPEEIDVNVLEYLRDIYEEDQECSDQEAEEIAEMLELPVQDVVNSLIRLENRNKVVAIGGSARKNCKWQAYGPKISWED